MKTARLNQVHRVLVDANVVRTTLDVLRRFGAHHLEGLVLWLGDVNADRARVAHAIVPDQEAITGENGVGYSVSGETLFKLNRTLAETGLRLIAQVHSHPGEAYHSRADDEYAIVTAEGGFSLVVPDFGKAPQDPSEWAIYRLTNGNWRELTSTEAQSIFHVDEP